MRRKCCPEKEKAQGCGRSKLTGFSWRKRQQRGGALPWFRGREMRFSCAAYRAEPLRAGRVDRAWVFPVVGMVNTSARLFTACRKSRFCFGQSASGIRCLQGGAGIACRGDAAKKSGGPEAAAEGMRLCGAYAFFSGRKEARIPRARKPTTTLREIMAGRWMTPVTSSSILMPMKARMAMTDFSRWRR